MKTPLYFIQLHHKIHMEAKLFPANFPFFFLGGEKLLLQFWRLNFVGDYIYQFLEISSLVNYELRYLIWSHLQVQSNFCLIVLFLLRNYFQAMATLGYSWLTYSYCDVNLWFTSFSNKLNITKFHTTKIINWNKAIFYSYRHK